MDVIEQVYNDALNESSKDLKGLFDQILMRTPIKTGAARASLSVTRRAFNRNRVNYRRVRLATVRAKLEQDKLEYGTDCTYYDKLEAGLSKQAPFGVFGLTYNEFKGKYT